MEILKCPSCGANLHKNSETCPYCETTLLNTLNNTKQKDLTLQKASSHTNGKRPKINWFLATFLLMCELIPGLIYIFIVKACQNNWDKQNNK